MHSTEEGVINSGSWNREGNEGMVAWNSMLGSGTSVAQASRSKTYKKDDKSEG